MRAALIDPSNFSIPYEHCLAEALEEAGCNVALFCSPLEWPYQSRYRRHEIFYPFGRRFAGQPQPLRKIIKGLEHVLANGQVIRSIEAFRPDVVHFQWTPVPPFDARWMCRHRRRGIPVVYTAHNLIPHDTTERAALAYRGVYHAADAIVVHHAAQREEVTRLYGVPLERVHHVPMGHFGYVRQHASGGRNLPEHLRPMRMTATSNVLFFGNIRPYKGLDLLIEAMGRIKDRHPSSRLIIAGRSQEPWPNYERLIADAGLSARVILWQEYIGDESIADLFECASIVALPYRAIDQSAVALTALGLGKAIVATKVGGFVEVVREGVNGLMTPPGDVAAFAAALDRLLSSPVQAEAMGRASLEMAQQEHSWKTAAEKTLAIYRSLACSRP